MTIPKKHVRTLVWSLLLGMALYVAATLSSDLHAIKESLLRLGVSGWSSLLLLSLLSFLLRFTRWQMYLIRLGHRVPVGRSLAYYIAAFTFTTSPGKAGEAIKSVYLKQHGVSYTASLAALFSEFFLDVVTVFLLALMAGLAFEKTMPAVIVMGLLSIALLPLIHSRRLATFLETRGGRLREGLPRKLLTSGVGLLKSSAILLKSGPLYIGLGLGLLAWGATGLGFWVVLQHLNVDIAVPVAISIVAISLLVGAASFLMGGLGSTEAVMGLLLMLNGMPAAQAIAATIIYRLGTLWFAILLGMACLAWLEAPRTRRREALTDEE